MTNVTSSSVALRVFGSARLLPWLASVTAIPGFGEWVKGEDLQLLACFALSEAGGTSDQELRAKIKALLGGNVVPVIDGLSLTFAACINDAHELTSNDTEEFNDFLNNLAAALSLPGLTVRTLSERRQQYGQWVNRLIQSDSMPPPGGVDVFWKAVQEPAMLQLLNLPQTAFVLEALRHIAGTMHPWKQLNDAYIAAGRKLLS